MVGRFLLVGVRSARSLELAATVVSRRIVARSRGLWRVELWEFSLWVGELGWRFELLLGWHVRLLRHVEVHGLWRWSELVLHLVVSHFSELLLIMLHLLVGALQA